MSDDITETAKAVQEVARATGKTVDALARSGSFFAKHIDAPLEAAIGHITDRLRYSRTVRQMRLFVRFQEEMQALGLEAKTRPLPLGFAVDAIEQGSLEDDDELQDLWARLLANAARADSGIQPRRSYISILKDLTALDALVFQKIYELEVGPQMFAYTAELPEAATTSPKRENGAYFEPNDEIKASLSNLDRLGLVSLAMSNDGAELHYAVQQTFAGHDLMRALRRPGGAR